MLSYHHPFGYNWIKMDDELTGLTEMITRIDIQTSYPTEEKIMSLIHRFFSFFESEITDKDSYDILLKDFINLPRETLFLIIHLAEKEKSGYNTNLRMIHNLNNMARYNVTNFRETDVYYINIFIAFLQNLM